MSPVLTTVRHFRHFFGYRCQTSARQVLGPSLVPKEALQRAPKDPPRTFKGPPKEHPGIPKDLPRTPQDALLVQVWSQFGPRLGLFRFPSSFLHKFPFRFPFRFLFRFRAWFSFRFPFRFHSSSRPGSCLAFPFRFHLQQLLGCFAGIISKSR